MTFKETEDSSNADNKEVVKSDEGLNENPKEKNSYDLTKKEHKEKFIEKDLNKEVNNKLYEEILEKLNIDNKDKKQRNQEESLQENVKKETYLDNFVKLERSLTKKQIEKVLSQDFDKIQNLVKSGLINSEQGQNLKKQVLKKAFDRLVQKEKIKKNLLPAVNSEKQQDNKNIVLENFSKNNPDFFSSNGRKEVLNYLKSGNVALGEEDIGKISEIIKIVEQSAIEEYLKQLNHENTLKTSNNAAKQRLTANAQKSNYSGSYPKSFTREQIGKMSGTDFAKYEPLIMEQLKKGLIK